MKEKEIKRRYAKLVFDVATNDFYKIDLKNRVNCYVCKCGHVTKTIDIHAGVTPFVDTCEKCNGLANSTFYNDIKPDQKPTREWYRPELKELLHEDYNHDGLDHVLRGGLEVRDITPKP